MNSKVMLEVKDLQKTYKKFSLKKINFQLEKGKIMGFIGPNGAGKSTTIKSIMNIIPFDGEIIINGLDNVENEIIVKQIIGYVSEKPNLYGEVKAMEIVHFVKKYYKNWDNSLFDKLTKRLDLNLYKKVKEFSKGNLVKFLLLLALSHHTELLVLDEPTSGLDPLVRDEVLEILLEIVENDGTSVLFSSHITEDIDKIADIVTFIDEGSILLSDTKENILNSYKKVEFRNEVPKEIINNVRFSRKKSIITDDITLISNLKNDVHNKVEIKQARLDDILLFLVKWDINQC